MDYQPAPEGKDPQLWHLAQRRASFKRHLTTYVIMNIFFWVLWYFTSEPGEREGLPWPVWPLLGWGIGLAFHYVSAYLATGEDTVEKEYQKLIHDRDKQ